MIDDSDFIFAQSLREKKCFCWCHTNTLGTILRRFPHKLIKGGDKGALQPMHWRLKNLLMYTRSEKILASTQKYHGTHIQKYSHAHTQNTHIIEKLDCFSQRDFLKLSSTTFLYKESIVSWRLYFLDQSDVFLIWFLWICAAQCTAPTAASRQIGCIKWGPWLGFGKWTCAPSFGDHPAPTAAAANLSKYEANFCQILWTHVIAGTKFVNRRSTQSKFQFNFVDICPLIRESSWQY